MNRTRNNPLADDLVRPLLHTSVWFYGIALVLATVVACGAAAWAYQIWYGIGVAGINWPVYWGFYLTNFVFWIGISHAGTLISAILRLVNARWRRPVTRCAEVITVFALMIGAMFPIIHLGKPWLFFWLAPYPSARDIWPNFRSPLVWDFFAINTYLTGSLLFLLLPMIPDFALDPRPHDRAGASASTARSRSAGRAPPRSGTGSRPPCRSWRWPSSRWRCRCTPSCRSTSRWPHVPMWHSTIFGPYFVAGAIFSGIAALIIAMAVLRRMLKLHAYLHPLHFDNLAKLLLLMSLLWGYFVFSERLTVWYGNEPSEMAVFWATQRGAFAPFYWTMVVCNFVVPAEHPVVPAAAHHPRHGAGVVRRGSGHVARALPHHRAGARRPSSCPTAGATTRLAPPKWSSWSPPSRPWPCSTCSSRSSCRSSRSGR